MRSNHLIFHIEAMNDENKYQNSGLCEILLSDSDNVHTEKDELFPFVQFPPRPLKVFQHRHSGRKRYKRKAVKSKPCADTIFKSESF